MSKCLYCQDDVPEGMMVCPTCMNNLTPSGDCRKCLHFSYCTDKGNHAYRGCGYCVDKNEYVKVVRCKDCKYYSVMQSCLFHCIDVGENDFCNYGEKAGK